jgi:hypothetical protein
MPMIKNSTLIYVCSNCENSELIVKESLGSMLDEFQQVQKYLNLIQVKAPDLIVNNVLDFSKNNC